ncbi:MAG: guanylate kinase [Alphaproteobacteria bacterium]|nr:guanylate kinase [Alphaproteobacteria bacterium]OJV47045.1 MAG: guanylate kinase [Alphaproteobacteria bacterium 43-37]
MDQEIQRKGLLIVLSSPSGAGKSSLAKALLDTDLNTRLSVSATTRPKRPAEIDGVHYHFITDGTFEDMNQRGEFIETVEMYGKKYGTPLKPILEALESGNDVIFDIDSIGARMIREAMGENVVSIFILPPSIEELEKRLRTRSQDSEDSIRTRLKNAAHEMSFWEEYDYVITNKDLGESLKTLNTLVACERMKRYRQVSLTKNVSSLINSCLALSKGQAKKDSTH